MTIDQYRRTIASRLSAVFDQREADASARAIVDDMMGYDARRLVMYGDRELEQATQQRVDRAVERIIAGEPVQYVTGVAHFCGLKFMVRPGVLIPRPETQWIVDAVADDAEARSDLRVLDACTGSGCIALALGRRLHFAQITAFDISPHALAVAKINATDLGVSNLVWQQADLFTYQAPNHAFDYIVSNPPYVLPTEELDRRVAAYEPAQALFVDANHPLAMVESLAALAAKSLAPDGKIYIEINPLLAGESCEALTHAGLTDAQVHCDYLGRKRFVTANQPKR